MKEIIKEETNKEKETAEILKDAATLYQDLYAFGKLQTQNEPDYDFMEQYTKLKKLQKLNTYVAFLQQKRSN